MPCRLVRCVIIQRSVQRNTLPEVERVYGFFALNTFTCANQQKRQSAPPLKVEARRM